MNTPFADPPDQLGCVVPDLQVAISEWAAKGVGPFLTMRKVTLSLRRADDPRRRAAGYRRELGVAGVKWCAATASPRADSLAVGRSMLGHGRLQQHL